MIKRVMVRDGKECPICGLPMLKGMDVLSFELSKTAFDNIHYGCRRNCGWVGKVNAHRTASSDRCVNHLLELTRVPLELSIKLRKAGVSAVKVDPSGSFSHKGIIEDARSIGHLLPQIFKAGATVKINGIKIQSMKDWKDKTDVVGNTIWQ